MPFLNFKCVSSQ